MPQDNVSEERDLPTQGDEVTGESSGKTVIERLRALGVMGDSEQQTVEVEYLGHGQFEDFRRHGQRRELPVSDAQRLLGLDGEDGPLFKEV